jgi:hypothetical protein
LFIELSPASFDLSEMEIFANESSPYDSVRIQIMVSNEGGAPGTCDLVLILNGEGAGQRQVDVDPGQTENVTFLLTKLAPGEYRVNINGKTGQFTLESPPASIAEISSSPEASTQSPVSSPPGAFGYGSQSTYLENTDPPGDGDSNLTVLSVVAGLAVVSGAAAGITIFRHRLK